MRLSEERPQKEGRKYWMKNKRQEAILDIISEYDIETQDELASKLSERGFGAAQATVSRDIKELGLVKISAKNGASKYARLSGQVLTIPEQLLPVFTHGFVSADSANNLIVIKTLPGMAQAVASAIDSLAISELLGTIAGDDTILSVCRSEEYAQNTVKMLKELVR